MYRRLTAAKLSARPLAGLAALLSGLLVFGVSQASEIYASKNHSFRVATVAEGLDQPWGVAFLPGGDLLVTELPGTLRRVSNGKVSEPLTGLPEVHASGQGGLLDIALHPDFTRNQLVYLTYSAGGFTGAGTELARAKLVGNRLEGTQVLFKADAKSFGGRHFGSRIRFLSDGTLLMTLGDRGDRHRAQALDNHAGSTIRLNDDGSIPADNPFVNQSSAKPEIYSLGHRNPQGLTIHPQTGLPWAIEHGPQGGDEVNVVRKGRNYGWPVITYGHEYGSGSAIGEGTHKAGMEQPVYYWDPSIAPAGGDFYTGAKFPKWQGNLFVAALKFRLVARLTLEGEKVVSEERLLEDKFGRIRDVRNGPDGYLYLLAGGSDGKILRLEPAN